MPIKRLMKQKKPGVDLLRPGIEWSTIIIGISYLYWQWYCIFLNNIHPSVFQPLPLTHPILCPLPWRLSSHHVLLSPQEIKVILDLPERALWALLDRKWWLSCNETQHWNVSTCPPLKNIPPPPFFFFLEISSLFVWCLCVWQLFSSAWCSILLEGGRWFRRFTVTLTDPDHLLPPPLPFSFFTWCTHDCTLHISTDDVNTQQHATHVESSWHFLKVCVIAYYLHIGESLLACCRNACDL